MRLAASFWRLLILGACALALFAASPARADCTGPAAPEGKIIYNLDYNLPQVCTGTQWMALGKLNPSAGGSGCSGPTGVEGQVIYNRDAHVPQYCDGDDWRAMIGFVAGQGSGACSGGASCLNVGDVCSDGTLFVGCALATTAAMYITRCDAGLTWNGSACTGTLQKEYWADNSSSGALSWTHVTSELDGPGNTVALTLGVVGGSGDSRTTAGLQTHNAAQYCADLDLHGHQDWYLPAKAEIWMVVRAEEEGLITGVHDNGPYWSSTEVGHDSNYANLTSSSGGEKETLNTVRCARRSGEFDNRPASTVFSDQFHVATSALTTSDIIQILDITSASVSIAGGGSPQYRICADLTCSSVVEDWTSASETIQNAQYLQLRLTSSGSAGTAVTATVTVGAGSDQWTVHTMGGNCGVSATGLAGYWKFDDASGTSAADASGNSNTGTLQNMETPADWVAGVHTGALAFDGNNERVVIPHHVSLNPTSAITVSVWLNADNWSGGNRRVLQKGDSDNQYILFGDGGVLRFHLENLNEVNTALPSTGVWHLVTATYDGASMRLYVDGVLAHQRAVTGPIPTTTNNLHIGTKNTGAPAGDHFDGTIDEVRIYSRTLSAGEVAQLYNGGTGCAD